MRLGFILESGASNSNYRVVFPMAALERRGHSVLWPGKLEEDVPLAALCSCDLVHCFRRLDRAGDLRQLAKRGVAVSFDNDDDLSAIDISSNDRGGLDFGARGRLGNMRKFNEMLKVARAADLTTTPSRALAAKFEAAGAANVVVIENHLDPSSMSYFGKRSKHDGIVIGWVAGKEHEADLARLDLNDSLSRLLDQHPDVRVVSVGSRLGLSSPRYEYRKLVPFAELAGVASGFDLGIAPLADTEFNRSRSNVKLKEYASGGAPWLASAVGPYRDMGEREGGRLVDIEQSWFGALDNMVRSGMRRRRLARHALRWAKTQVIDARASLWEDAFQQAIERAAARGR